MFDLKSFKRTNALRQKDIVTMLSRDFPKFSKACETCATYPDEYGMTLSPEAVKVLKGKFPDRTRKKDTRELVQIRCRVSDEFYERFKYQLGRNEQTAQHILTELLTVWVEAMELCEKKTAADAEAPTAAKDYIDKRSIAHGGENVKRNVQMR